MAGSDRKNLRRVPVLLPYPFPEPFDYAVPDGLDPAPGDAVLVPLNRRETVGVVWDQATPAKTLPDARLKPITALLDTPPMTESMRRFVDWVAAYTLSPPGEVMAMALRVTAPTPLSAGWTRADPPADNVRLTPARARVLAALAEAEPQAGRALAKAADASQAVLNGMAQAGLIRRVPLALGSPFARPDPAHPGPHLSAAQHEAAQGLRAVVAAQAFSVTLLDGVTGSGKTEVYHEAIAECLRQDRQALVLLPEIALSSQWLERFEARFGVAPAVWHSDLSSRTRRLTWRAVSEGAAAGGGGRALRPVPALPRSRSRGGGRGARDRLQAGGRRGLPRPRHGGGARTALCCGGGAVSATPSLETLANVEAGRYRHATLPVRHGGATLPQIAAIDMRATPPERGRFLSPPLIAAVQDTLARGEQAIAVPQPPRLRAADAVPPLRAPDGVPELHRMAGGAPRAAPPAMPPLRPRRADPGNLPCLQRRAQPRPVGPGVERITEEAAALFPDARRLVMASDTLPGPHAAAAAARSIADREVDLVIGTQIVAKGWHFPHLTLVGVIDADLGWPAVTCAPPSAPCSCCTRSPAALAAPRRRGRCCCKPSAPSIR